MRMGKLEIFDEIVRIMHEDSSSCKDKQGADPADFRAHISESMDKKDFLFTVRSYLASFGLTGHLGFGMNGMPAIPFKVQRYNNELYVKQVMAECPLKKGDRIIKLDGMSVKDFGEKHKEFLYNETEERQGFFWRQNLLRLAKNLTYIHGSDEIEIPVPNALNLTEEEPYLCKDLGNSTAYIKLIDFGDEEKIQKLYEDNAELLDNCRYLIADVRENGGGSDTAFLPLLKYALPNGKSLVESMVKEDYYSSKGSETNYSENNCDIRIEMFSEYLDQELPDETMQILNGMVQDLRDHRGEGFVKVQDDMDLPIVGDSKVEKFFIITDEGCASSGDSFVEIFKTFEKVTVVGRPTFGILDYSNIIIKEYGDYSFAYPTSRLCILDDGEGMTNHGIPVDIYVPWTPKQLEHDVMLEKVLELIDK